MGKGEIARYKRLVSQGCQKVSLCGNGLIVTFQLLSAASLNLGQSQNGVLGNGLTLSQMTNFRLFQTKSLQTTILNLMKMVKSSTKG